MSARDAALAALLAIERGAEAREALEAALARSRLDGRDRALATELTYGVTRWRARLDAELGAYLQRRTPEELPPAIRNVLRLGLYQLRLLDRVPAYAAVSAAVAQARRHGHEGTARLVNAVLRRAAAEAPPPPDPAVAWSHPAWLVRRWQARLGPEETAALLAADNRTPPIVLRTNLLRVTRDELLAQLAAEGVAAEPGRHCPEAVVIPAGAPVAELRVFRAGLCTVQDEASMLVGHVVDPQPGWLCLEVAAAPGGKATHLAELMRDQGTVVANDRDPDRARRIRGAARRLGLRAVRVRVGDARELPAAFADRCDAVLADLPCSGLGTLARRPDLRWRKTEGDLAQLAELQRALLAAAAACVRPGGVLVYSTCSTEPEEGEGVVDAFLAGEPRFREEERRRLWPHRDGTDGFFISRLRRR